MMVLDMCAKVPEKQEAKIEGSLEHEVIKKGSGRADPHLTEPLYFRILNQGYTIYREIWEKKVKNGANLLLINYYYTYTILIIINYY